MSDSTPSKPGSYVLLGELQSATVIEFGAAGTVDLDADWYAYAGSAFGAGGLGRVDRHQELARGERSVRHWHVDYLLGHPGFSLVDTLLAPGRDVECDLADALSAVATTLPLGASDCDCTGHLFHAASALSLRESVTGIIDDADSR